MTSDTGGTPGEPDAASLERIVPQDLTEGDATGTETLALHTARYEFAADHARPGRALDLACGVGYGTRILTDRNPAIASALGVDLAGEAIAHANEHYHDERTRYAVGDALAFVDPDGFDTVVSIETIEHLERCEEFVARLAGLLRPGGVVVASVPVTPTVDANPHHRRDFSERSFHRMLESAGLAPRHALRQVQRFSPVAIAGRSERRMQEIRPNLAAYYAGHPDAFARRIWSTLRYGFTNRYLTLACERVA